MEREWESDDGAHTCVVSRVAVYHVFERTLSCNDRRQKVFHPYESGSVISDYKDA
jgi:hypothetical protein